MIFAVCEFEPHVRLCADSSEPEACFGFCVSLSLCPSPAHALSLSKVNTNIKRNLSLFIYFEREKAQVGEGQREGERENPKQALCFQCRACHGAQIHKLLNS